nr:hypothetical protein [Candidatus Baldrarchaeota archaeon]
MKKNDNIYAKFIEVFGLKTKNKSKHLYSKDGNTFLTTHQEALKIFKNKKVLFIGPGETTKIKINNTNYLFFLRGRRAVEVGIVRKIEKVLGRKYFWIIGKHQQKDIIAASNGEYAIITQVKHVKILF